MLDPAFRDHIRRMVPELVQKQFRYNDRPLILDPWQIDVIGTDYNREVDNKARQIGASFIRACRALARAMLFPDGSYHAVFVSINKEESMEKIRYIADLHAELPTDWKIEKVNENKTDVWFANGNSIRSFPSKEVRGVPKAEICLDEFAHIDEARKILTGSSPASIREDHGLAMTSSPCGHNTFWEAHTQAGQEGPWKFYKARTLPWWVSTALCIDIVKAQIWAPGMSTAERVHIFGQPALKQQFTELPESIFRQEFECDFQVSGNQAIPDNLIEASQDGTLPMEWPKYNDAQDRHNGVKLDQVIMACIKNVNGHNPGKIFIGYDVGRNVNPTEIVVLGWNGTKLTTRMVIELSKTPFFMQKMVMRLLLDNLDVAKCVIDYQGLGMEMAEEIERQYGGDKIHKMTYSMLSKDEMVSRLIKMMEDKIFYFYPTRQYRTHLQAVKKIINADGKNLYRSDFDVEEGGQRTHADLFWATAMATWGAVEVVHRSPIITSRKPILYIPGRGAFTPFQSKGRLRGL